jgi:solute carrier family 25 folate transporter 32
LDVLKTRLQVQGKAGAAMYKGVSGGLSKIMREEGMRGLYRGLTPTLVALLPNWAVYFTAYERLKQAIGSRVPPQWSASAGVHMAAAQALGAATMMITNPLWVIKTRLQTQNMGIRMGASGNPALYRGTLDALLRIAREEGVAGLYRWGLCKLCAVNGPSKGAGMLRADCGMAWRSRPVHSAHCCERRLPRPRKPAPPGPRSCCAPPPRSGLGPSLLGVMHVVIQFPLYESLKGRFAQQRGDGADTLNL